MMFDLFEVICLIGLTVCLTLDATMKGGERK